MTRRKVREPKGADDGTFASFFSEGLRKRPSWLEARAGIEPACKDLQSSA
jgi:hypothetical protein